MEIKTLENNKLPNLSSNIKDYLKKGFWSLVEVKDVSGTPKLFIKTEKELYELTKTGNVKNIFNLNSFNLKINAKVNLGS